MGNFYVTTPIYYVNDKPHVGHAYSTIAADVLRRYHALRGAATYFLTGTDEHGQKIERRAADEGISPQRFVDSMAPAFRETADLLNCHYNDFIRTTEWRNKDCAQALWRRLEAAGDIYRGEYEGWYSVSSEAFFSEKDLLPGHLDPITKRPVEKVKEPSYFFRLSNYTQPLLDFYRRNPDFIRPSARQNEVLRFVEQGLHDLSISRSTFRWGVPVPGNPSHVMYVWLDALANYISALGGFEGDASLFKQFWTPSARVTHIVGKDILRFHAVYWPAFLMSAGIECPTQVWAHGWLTVDGEKMSKSIGNFIPPAPLVDAVGVDPLRYYLMRDIAFGQDGDFSHKGMMGRFNGELSNGLGNLLQRVIGGIASKIDGGRIHPVNAAELTTDEKTLIDQAREAATESAKFYDDVSLHRAVEAAWTLVNTANKYVDSTAPWALLKDGDDARLRQVIYTVAETLRWLSVLLWPVMPGKCDELRQQLGLRALMPAEGLDLWPKEWACLPPDLQSAPGKALFPRWSAEEEKELLGRLEVDGPDAEEGGRQRRRRTTQKVARRSGAPAPSAADAADSSDATNSSDAVSHAKETASTPPEGFVTFDQFMAVDLRIAQVKHAEPVPKSKRLLRLQVDLGEAGQRQILAGIAEHYQPESLIGKQLLVVANLPPRKMMGLESQGMVLAVKDDAGLSVVGPERQVTPGERVS